MKYAVLSDIHGNLEALQVVLADAEAQECTHYWCGGDTVGYGANPKECLDIIRSRNWPCVKGDHDEYISSEDDLDGFDPHAIEAVTWTRTQLTRDDRQWLRDLKFQRLIASFSIVHATLDAPQRFQRVFDKVAAAASFTYQNTQVCFYGHTHVPVAFVRDHVVRGGSYSKFKVEPGRKYFVNVGSVGQPRDGNPKTAYVIYDLDEGSIEIRRLDYDIATAQRKMLAAGLSGRLAMCLALGVYRMDQWEQTPPVARVKSAPPPPPDPPAPEPPSGWKRLRKWLTESL